jgi:hypothetical protein
MSLISLFDVAPVSFILPILFFVLLPLVAIVCVVVALVIMKKRKKIANPPEAKEAKIESVKVKPNEQPAENRPVQEEKKDV